MPYKIVLCSNLMHSINQSHCKVGMDDRTKILRMLGVLLLRNENRFRRKYTGIACLNSTRFTILSRNSSGITRIS